MHAKYMCMCMCMCICNCDCAVSSVSAYVSVSVAVSMTIYARLCIDTVQIHLCLVNNLYIVVSSKREISRISAS